MKRLLLLILAAFGFCFSSSAQTPEIDSLLTMVRTAKEDSHKVNFLNELSKRAGIKVGNYDTASYYAENAMQLAKKLKFKKGIAEAYNNIGIVCWYQGDYPNALKNQSACLELSEDIGDKAGVASSHTSFGLIYLDQGKYADALKSHLIALKIREETGSKQGMANSYLNIGSIYYRQGKYPDALKNYFAYLRLQEDMGNRQGISDAYYGIGLVYYEQENRPEALKNFIASLEIKKEIGDKNGIAACHVCIGSIYTDQENYPDALKSYFASLKISEEIGNKGILAMSYNNIGLLYEKQGNYRKARKNQLISLDLMKEIGHRQGIAVSFISLGFIYTKTQRYEDARKCLNDGLSLSKEIGTIDFTRDAYKGLSELDDALGNGKQALAYYKLYTLYKDSLLNEDSNEQIAQMKTLYESEKKDAEITLLNKDKELQTKEIEKQEINISRQRIGLASAGVGLLLIMALAFSIQQGKKKSDELLLNILPAETAKELKAKGYADAKQFDQVTVLFTDFKGFTQISERLTPKELVASIDECFKAFDEIISKHGIEKIKTIGDAYMAAGGLPTANATNPEDIVKAGLEIRDWMLQYRERKGENGFEVRIGVHTGPVVAGIVGIKKFAYDIWGDTVNTASRMESSGGVGKVNVSQATYELLKDDAQFTCESRGKVEAKGKGEMEMYFVESANA